jgi:hypothetical protein
MMNELEMAVLADANDRAVRGAAWLDARYPAWESILRDRVDIGSVVDCVLGQLYGSFSAALRVTPDQPGWLEDHGFCADDTDGPTNDDLSAAWETMIYARGARRFLAHDQPQPTRLAA